MELDAHTIRKIEDLAGENILIYDRVSSLSEASPNSLNVAARIALIVGGSILAIQFLRYISECTLAEAVDFLNNVRQANGE